MCIYVCMVHSIVTDIHLQFVHIIVSLKENTVYVQIFEVRNFRGFRGCLAFHKIFILEN